MLYTYCTVHFHFHIAVLMCNYIQLSVKQYDFYVVNMRQPVPTLPYFATAMKYAESWRQYRKYLNMRQTLPYYTGLLVFCL